MPPVAPRTAAEPAVRPGPYAVETPPPPPVAPDRTGALHWLLTGVTMGAGATALDYGCGDGDLMVGLAPRFARVDGVDRSVAWTSTARRRCHEAGLDGRAWLIEGEGLPPGLDGQYDVACSVGYLQHLCIRASRIHILRSLFDALKPGGLLTFQMGYGPGHADVAGYDEDRADDGRTGTSQVCVLHPGEIGADLVHIGFTSLSFSLQPAGERDSHGAWIYVRALKPGTGAALDTSIEAWLQHGFQPLRWTPEEVARTRARHLRSGVIGRQITRLQQFHALEARHRALQLQRRTLAGRIRELDSRAAEREARMQTLAEEHSALASRGAALADQARSLEGRLGTLDTETRMLRARCGALEDERRSAAAALQRAAADAADLRMAHDAWRARATDWQHAHGAAARTGRQVHDQLTRLQSADRARVRAIVGEYVQAARHHGWRLAVFGAGSHTESLLRDTALNTVPRLDIFDSHPEARGGRCGGLPVRPAAELAAAAPDIVIVSSLAFQDEMAGFVERLGLRHAQVLCCYP